MEQVVQRNGKSGKKRAAKEPSTASLRTLLVNMEQWRWMPADLGNFYVWVNIPEYTIRVVRADRIIHSERVIVGRTNTQTPVFSDEMQQVIFHPFWGVPDSIKTNELLPSLARGNTGVLERNGLRVSYRGRDINPGSVDWTKVDMRKFHVYQPPGGSNVLGVVKFRFPNKHDVYMHDTPSKSLFNASVRTFSHGCMRVRDPLKLAEIVLAEERGWPAEPGRRRRQSRAEGQPDQSGAQGARAHDLLHGLGRRRRQVEDFCRHLRPRKPHRAGDRGQGPHDSARTAKSATGTCEGTDGRIAAPDCVHRRRP